MSEFKLIIILNETFHQCTDEEQNKHVKPPAEFKSGRHQNMKIITFQTEFFFFFLNKYFQTEMFSISCL